MAEKYISDFLNTLTYDDYKKDIFLMNFYKAYNKESTTTNLYDFYIYFITKSIEFINKDLEINNLINEIYNKIINYNQHDDAEEKVEKLINTNRKTENVKLVLTEEQKYRENVMFILSDYIKQSIIVVADNNTDNTDIPEQIHEAIYNHLFVNDEGDDFKAVVLPESQVMAEQTTRMSIWYNTYSKCSDLKKNSNSLVAQLSKFYLIELSNIIGKIKNLDVGKKMQINTDFLESPYPDMKTKKTYYIIPPELLENKYSNANYTSRVIVLKKHPLDEVVKQSKEKINPVYIMTGSPIVCGSNSEQGINSNESKLYLTSTYSIATEIPSAAFPLRFSQALSCNKILVFKNEKYELLPTSEWVKISVINSPSLFRPNVTKTKSNTMYDASYTVIDYEKTVYKIKGTFELALFMGHDNIIIDDCGIVDNQLPIRQTLEILRDCINEFKGRFRQITVCTENENIFGVMQKLL